MHKTLAFTPSLLNFFFLSWTSHRKQRLLILSIWQRWIVNSSSFRELCIQYNKFSSQWDSITPRMDWMGNVWSLEYKHLKTKWGQYEMDFLVPLVCYPNKVNRCLARYSPRATTTNRPTNRAPNKPAWPGPNWPKMPILGQIWSFLGKKSFFLLEKS